jgi:hypothetical protein
MKKVKLVPVIVASIVLVFGAGLLLKNRFDPRARAIRDAKGYSPTGNAAHCTQSITPAKHAESGALFTFPDGCLPPGWSVVPQPSAPVSVASFDIEAFYEGLQIGMSASQVVELAGRQPDDCSYTDSEPPSVTCYWTSGVKATTVYYGKTSAVQAKNKTGF